MDNQFSIFISFVVVCAAVYMLASFMQSLPAIIKCIKRVIPRKQVEYTNTCVDITDRKHQMKLRSTVDDISHNPRLNEYLLWTYISTLHPETLEGTWKLNFPTALTARLTKTDD